MVSSANVEWFTPRWVLDLVREVIGDIDLDPASCIEAQERVRAKVFYSLEDDGLMLPWIARSVFLNPPYGEMGGESSASIWFNVMELSYRLRYFGAGMFLCNGAIGSQWFAKICNRFPVAFFNKRIRFDPSFISALVAKLEGRKLTQPSIGNAIVYLGPDVARFIQVFEPYCWFNASTLLGALQDHRPFELDLQHDHVALELIDPFVLTSDLLLEVHEPALHRPNFAQRRQ